MGAPERTALQWPLGALDFSPGCLIMGVLNVTPDSFSDGGLYLDTDSAVRHGLDMAAAGAAIIDVGGESTRPGSEPVSCAAQIQRVVPVIEALSRRTQIPISVDAHDAEVVAAALNAGAAIVNDVTALADDRTAALVAERQVPVVLMHMQGTPAVMQRQPAYDDVVGEVCRFLLDRAEKALSGGIPAERIFIDPGIGFGKTQQHNLLLLRHINRFVATGYRVLVGTSRKRFLGAITGRDRPADRVFGTAATVALCATAGVSVVRVHDVAEMRDVIAVVEAVRSA